MDGKYILHNMRHTFRRGGWHRLRPASWRPGIPNMDHEKEDPMKKLILCAALAACGLLGQASAGEQHGIDFDDDDDSRSVTIAVFGDWPYNQNLLDNAPRLIGSVNADEEVRLVMHVGDIHSGSMPCTSADILPAIATSNPGWNQKIYFQFQQFKAPVIYTPGDNEWTDCHKAKQKSSGAPLNELAAVRSLFFARPGHSLGQTDKKVFSQAEYFDPAYPTDAKFVENVMWRDGRVVFLTLNMPGSNNDSLPWTGNFANPALQTQEAAERNAADLRWLEAGFKAAQRHHAKAVVIGLQADMWDPAALPTAVPAGDGLDKYTPFVKKLADLARQFKKPVLLLNGDSHLYGADKPLADPNSASGRIHNQPAVPNLTRITVQGSTNAPAEWLRLTIDPEAKEPFSWSNVAYCADPLGSCQ
jgi:hypothetical protein